MSDLAELHAAWTSIRDGASGQAYGHALESSGDAAGARQVYGELIESGYLVGYYHLAWLERDAGNHAESTRLLRTSLEMDDEPDEQTALVSGVLGHWIWTETHDIAAESLLRAGATEYSAARADLAELLRATDRTDEAESTLREGVASAEVESFIVLGNLLDETGRPDEAEHLYRRGFALGDAHSAYNLYLLLARAGRDTEALEWLQLAADGGDTKAATRLTATD